MDSTETETTPESAEFEARPVSKEMPTKKHPLKTGWSFWFMRRVQGPRSQENYEKNIKCIGSFFSVEDFWAYYNHIVRPTELTFSCDFHLFRAGVKPMWEDDENKNGGKFQVRIPRGKKTTSRYWEDILIAIVGGQFDVPSDEICGVVISTRYHQDILSLWNKRSEATEDKRKIHDTLKKVLGLPAHLALEYKNHAQALTDNPRPGEKAKWEQT